MSDEARDGPLRLVELSALAGLTEAFLAGQSLARLLTGVAELAKQVAPSADEASVTLLDRGRASSVAFTGDLAVRLDERQYETGFGPSLEAATSGGVVELADTAQDGAYPAFCRQARLAGVTRVLTLGLPVPGRAVGAVTLYGRGGRGFDAASVAWARAVVSQASVLLTGAQLLAATADEVTQLRAAMASRAEIEQATGVIMARTGGSAEDAFQHLVRLSSLTNRKLRDVAVTVVADRGDTL